MPDPDPSALRSKVPQGIQFDNTLYVSACLSCMKLPASTRTLHLLNCPPLNEARYAQILDTDCVSIRILKVLIPDIEDAHQHLVHICQGSESDYRALKKFWLRSSLCMQQAGTGSAGLQAFSRMPRCQVRYVLVFRTLHSLMIRVEWDSSPFSGEPE